MAQAQNIVRGRSTSGPALVWANKVGTPVTTITGTATYQGSWQVQLQQWSDDFLWAITRDSYGGSARQRPIQASKAYTDIVPGLTITFGASPAAGNIFNVAYTDVYVAFQG